MKCDNCAWNSSKLHWCESVTDVENCPQFMPYRGIDSISMSVKLVTPKCSHCEKEIDLDTTCWWCGTYNGRKNER